MSALTKAPARPSDYIALMKPRVMVLAVFTACVGYVLAPASQHFVLALAAVLCIALGAGAAGVLNMWFDADIDAQMQRTKNRPIPRGVITRSGALELGGVLSFLAVYSLGVMVNWFAAAWLAFTIGFYLFYTMWLKRRTAQNIVIGGLAGALPPVIGWAAAGGGVAVYPALLCLVIFLWTPPHFWALALLYEKDYARANVPMLPNVAGAKATKRQIVLYSIATALAGIAPSLLGLASIALGVFAGLAGLGLVWLALVLWRSEEKAQEKPAKQLFFGSILYLFALFLGYALDGMV